MIQKIKTFFKSKLKGKKPQSKIQYTHNYGHHINGKLVVKPKKTWYYGRGWVLDTTKAPVDISTPPKPETDPKHPPKSSSTLRNTCQVDTAKMASITKSPIPSTFHECLKAAPLKCCNKIPKIVTIFHMLMLTAKTVKAAKVVNELLKSASSPAYAAKTIGKLFIKGIISLYIMNQNVTKIELVERPLPIAIIISMFAKPCVTHVTGCMQNSNMWTNLDNEPEKLTHSAALLYTRNGRYLLEKGISDYKISMRLLLNKCDREFNSRLCWWRVNKTLIPAKERKIREYYDAVCKGYDLFSNNCHDATKAVEKLAKSNDAASPCT